MGPSRRRDLAGNIALLGGSAVVSLGVAVAFLKACLPINPTVYRLDDVCLYRLVPGSTKVFTHLRKNGGERITVRTNSRGYRGEELGARAGSRRIVVYGDSFIEAEFSRLEDTFVKRLEGKLNAAPGSRVEAVNAGVVGYGPDQVSLRLESEVDDLGPDLVIVAIASGNDFGDLLRNKLYRLDAQGRLLRTRPVLSPSLRRHLALSAEGERVDGGIFGRSLTRLYWALNPKVVVREAGLPERGGDEGLIEWALRASRLEYEDAVVRGNPEVANLFGDHYDADVTLDPGSESARYKVALIDQVLGRIQAMLDSRGIPLLLVLIPDAIDACPDHHFRVTERLFEGHAPSTATEVLAGIAGRRGIPYVDLFGPFREAGAGRLYYREPETHWNTEGQDLAARVVGEFVLSRGLVRPRQAG